MRKIKCLIFLLAVAISEITAIKVFYVLPDNSTNVSCPSLLCATLNQYFLGNGTLPVLSNVEYHFLPGKHYVPDNFILRSLFNFSLVGIVSKPSSLPVLVDCFHSDVLKIYESHYVNIRNIEFQHCYNPQLQHVTSNLYIFKCFSCTIENMNFNNFGMIGHNLIGNSRLNEIHITHTKGLFCSGIRLQYWDDDQILTAPDHNVHHLLINKLSVTGNRNRSKCYHFKDAYGTGVYVDLTSNTKTSTITINNSLFKELYYPAIHVKSKCGSNTNLFIITNCSVHSLISSSKPSIIVELSKYNKYILFKKCTFKNNHGFRSVVSIQITKSTSIKCTLIPWAANQSHIFSAINLKQCQFNLNEGKLLQIDDSNKDDTQEPKIELCIIGPVNITNNKNIPISDNLMLFRRVVVHITGPVLILHNSVGTHSLLVFISSEVIFYDTITFKANNCAQVISLITQGGYIKVMEHTNITFIQNKCKNKLIDVIAGDIVFNFCLFQYMAYNKSSAVVPSNYAINIFNTSSTQQQIECSFIFYYFTPICKWLPNAALREYDSQTAYNEIIQIDATRKLNYHKICICYNNGSYDCSISILGTLHPGQLLQVALCTPCSDRMVILYTEVHKSLLTNSSCRITDQTEMLNIIRNYSKLINYTIASEAPKMCDLYLTLSPDEQQYEVFYVQLLPCPMGFTLQDGVCDCDPVLPIEFDRCYIEHSTIRCPANTWITAYTQANDTEYLISDCPMDFCLSYSLNIDLLYPDEQCQFNRTGILCSQCQSPLSMVFGSSRCMECTNLHILITIIVIVAGIVLVVSLYLLNLTVTIGTINGIIFYANIVSINDSIFLANDNVFTPLRVFVSFVNLDLGIETCFYNGMDSYAKIWLQLFFPFYLIIIAISIIIASRYSSRILRLTFTRSLPVLATLFLLSYNGVLRMVSTVLFSYSTITHLPSNRQQMVWSIDASVPLFGLKFTVLFITCLVLFLLLIPFNITLLFTRYLSQFRTINRFKPLIDAFQGSYKDKFYNWPAVHIILRSIFLSLYGFQTKPRLIIATIILVLFTGYHGYSHPYKNKLVDIQEFLLLINVTIMYAVSYYGSESIFSVISNTMIGLAFIQFCIIVLHHFLTYTCHCDIVIMLQKRKQVVMTYYRTKKRKCQNSINVELLDIPECTYSYAEYQDGLVSDDFQ